MKSWPQVAPRPFLILRLAPILYRFPRYDQSNVPDLYVPIGANASVSTNAVNVMFPKLSFMFQSQIPNPSIKSPRPCPQGI